VTQLVSSRSRANCRVGYSKLETLYVENDSVANIILARTSEMGTEWYRDSNAENRPNTVLAGINLSA